MKTTSPRSFFGAALRTTFLWSIPAMLPIYGCMAETDVHPLEVSFAENSLIFCNANRAELAITLNAPLSAVGYLSNGCTATLIDTDTIAAAAHCFVVNGVWQTDNLRFYPNFHPDRVASETDLTVPHATVERAVVGRVVDYGQWQIDSRNDWGIAKLKNWKNDSGISKTPVALSTAAAAGQVILNPSYSRFTFPAFDLSPPDWDNSTWQTPCGWMVTADNAPDYLDSAGVQRSENKGCNQRWSAGFVYDGLITSVASDAENDGLVIHDADGMPGSSGSPLLLYQSGSFVLVGVQNAGGGGLQGFDTYTPGPTCAPPATDDAHRHYAAGAERFYRAPRFTRSVAIDRKPTVPSATALYVVDDDRDDIVMRSRNGSSPSHGDAFGWWSNLGHYGNAELNKVSVCTQSGQPVIIATRDSDRLTQRLGNADGTWGAWATFSVPSGVTNVVDIDFSTDSTGKCQLYLIGNGNIWTRRRDTATSWGSWSLVASNGTFHKVTALNYDSKRWVAAIDGSGQVWQSQNAGSSWTVPAMISAPGTQFIDIDMTWDEQERGVLFAIPANFLTSSTSAQAKQPGDGKLWFSPMYSPVPLSVWLWFETSLYNPYSGGMPPLPNLRSITASRWMEDEKGETSPNIFATDNQGNIYFIEYTRASAPDRWVLDWKPFYDAKILYN